MKHCISIRISFRITVRCSSTASSSAVCTSSCAALRSTHSDSAETPAASKHAIASTVPSIVVHSCLVGEGCGVLVGATGGGLQCHGMTPHLSAAQGGACELTSRTARDGPLLEAGCQNVLRGGKHRGYGGLQEGLQRLLEEGQLQQELQWVHTQRSASIEASEGRAIMRTSCTSLQSA
jgi:hypothetical protein